MDALTKDIFHGLNLLTIIGFIAMGIGLNQSRQGRARAPLAFALMIVGTVLVFAGLYVSHTAAG
jgi:membrane-bound ClpP family serine protease